MPEDDTPSEKEMIVRATLNFGAKAFVALMVITIIGGTLAGTGVGFTVIDEGEIGVKTQLGRVVDGSVEPGLKLFIPFIERIHKYSVRAQTYTMSSTKGEGSKSLQDDSIEALTKEGLNINMDISVRFHINGSEAGNVYRSVGNQQQLIETIVRPTIRSGVRSSTSEYSVNEIYADKRDELANTIDMKISEDFTGKGLTIERIQIRNVMLPDKVRQAIQEKEAAQQQIETKQNQIEIERAERERKIIEARAIAESNQIIGQSLSQQYLRWYWIREGLKKGDAMYVPIGNDGLPMFKDVDQTSGFSGNYSFDGNTSGVQDLYNMTGQ